MHRTLPAISDIDSANDHGDSVMNNHIHYTLPSVQDSTSSPLLTTSSKVANGLTLFPQLLPELRLIIWQLTLPKLHGNLLYPYQKGCWIFEEIGLAPDPSGEDLYFRFDASRLEPLHIALSKGLTFRAATIQVGLSLRSG